MKKVQFPKSGLFLIEFMIVLLFFSISAVVCVSIFVHANRLNQENSEKNRALFLAQSMAEEIKGSGLTGLYEMDHEKTRLGYSFYYDENWEKTDRTGKQYEMTVVVTPEGNMEKAYIIVKKEEQELFSLPVKHYIPIENKE